jgi:hypothetical protein
MTAKTGDITTTRHRSIGSDIRHETVVSGDYLVLDSDQDIVVTGQVAPVTITLPPTLVAGRAITVRDEGGFAVAFPVTVSGNGNLLNGAPTQTLLTANAMLSIIGGSTQWNGAFANAGPVSASFLQLTGAGPFAMSSTPTDTIGIDPTGNDTVLNLPSLAGVASGKQVTIENNGAGIDGITPTGSVVLLRNGTNVIGNAAIFSRLYAGGSIHLQANVTAGRWEITGFEPGSGDIVNFVDTVAGLDTNPGTALLPVKSYDGALGLLPTSHKGLCRATCVATVAGAIIKFFGTVASNGCVFPPHPVGSFAEPFTLIGLFADSGLGSRTASAVSVLAGAAGVLITDSGVVTGVTDTFAGYRFRVTSGPATGTRAAIATNTAGAGGTFLLLVPTLAGFSAIADTYVIELPATGLQHGGANAFRPHGPDALGFYGLQTPFLDFQPSNGAVIAMESCWFGSGFYRNHVILVLGQLRASFSHEGIGVQGQGQVGVLEEMTNGACTLVAAPNISKYCEINGSFVTRGGPFTWSLNHETSVIFSASYGGKFTIAGECSLLLLGTVRHRTSGIIITARSKFVALNSDVSGGPVAGAIQLRDRSIILGSGIRGGLGLGGGSSANGGPGIVLDTGSGGSIDATVTITGSVPATNDLLIGLAGSFSQAALTAAGVISDFTVVGPPASTGVFLKRG